jgi:hypothetical protein
VAAPTGQRRDPVSLRLSAEPLVLTLWTSDPELARRADAAGVDRIGLDLERDGKRARQAGRGTWVSPHDEADLGPLAAAVERAALFARVEPARAGGVEQAARLAAAGVRVVMVPMFRGADEVAEIAAAAPGAAIVPLVETPDGVAAIEEVLAVPGVDEVHVGINDLSLALGLPNRFAVLCSPAVERVAAVARDRGARLGVGGLGRARQPGLPVPADLVYARQAQLGATSALMSRAFVAGAAVDLPREVARARERMAWWRAQPADRLERAARDLRAAVRRAATW